MSALANLNNRLLEAFTDISADRSSRIFFDCTDLIESLARHTTVTGIDRVQTRLLDYLLNFEEGRGAAKFFMAYRDDRGDIFEVGLQQTRQFVRLAVRTKLDKEVLAVAATECRRSACPAAMATGDLYFMPGPFWTTATHEGLIPRLKSKGVVFGAYIYDLIPITHPQFCIPAHATMFAAAFAEVAPQLDFALTISEFVADELRDMMAAQGIPLPPIIAAPLAHELETRTSYTESQERAVLARFRGRPFVLCVGTIEARKNHMYLLNIWNTLARENVKLPLLILVGRLGWRVSDLTEQLQSLRYVNDTIKIVNDVSDADLACLYDHCLFTIFPSFVEGWGLPVGESLARGKIVVASSAASIPEVGGPHAIYIDPYNLNTGLDVVRRLVTDEPYRQASELAVRNGFRPRTWAAAGEFFFSALVKGVEERTPRPTYAPALAPGRSLLLSDLVDESLDLSDYLRHPLRLILAAGWRKIDHGGSWIFDKDAIVRFATDLEEGTRIGVVMTFVTVPWLRDSALLIRGETRQPDLDARMQTRRTLQPSVMFRHMVTVSVGEGGVATMHFEIEGTPTNNPPDELSVLWIRMLTIGWCAIDDVSGRISLLEQALFS